MNLWHVPVDELTKIANAKGIEIPLNDAGRMNRKALIALLTEKMVADGEEIEATAVDEAGNAEAVETVKKVPPKRGWTDIVFRNQDGQPKYVFLGLNGRSLYLPREVPVRIPSEFMNVVRSAVSTKIVQNVSALGKIEHTEIQVPRLSYEVLATG